MTEDPEDRGYRPTRLWGQWQLQSINLSNGDGNERCPVGPPGVRGKSWQIGALQQASNTPRGAALRQSSDKCSKHGHKTRLKMVMLPTYWLKGLGACSKPNAVPTVITRVLTSQVVRDVAIRSIGAQPLLVVTTTPVRQIHLGGRPLLHPSIYEHDNRWQYWAAISRVNPFTTNGSTIWETQCSTGP